MLISVFKGVGWKKERDNFEAKIGEYLGHYEKLLNLLGEENKEKQRQRLANSAIHVSFQDRAHTKSVGYQQDAILDITTPEEQTYNEESEWLRGQKDGSS